MHPKTIKIQDHQTREKQLKEGIKYTKNIKRKKKKIEKGGWKIKGFKARKANKKRKTRSAKKKNNNRN